MQRRMLIQTGVDPDGRRVFSGVYAFFETHGLPLDLVLAWLWDHDEAVADWDELLRSMVTAGRPYERACETITAAIYDACYPTQARDVIIAKFQQLTELRRRS